jgi:dynein heavy chain
MICCSVSVLMLCISWFCSFCYTDDIAMLMQMREMMTQVPVAVAAQRPAIKDIMQSFDLLDDFAFRLPKEIFRLKWDIYGWPKKIHDQMISKDAELNLLRGTFLSEMRQQQEIFEKDKADAEKKVSGFGSHSDIDKMERFYAKAVEIHNVLEELQAKSRHFNNNESLFGLRSTDYSEVTRIAKNFEPFYMLWTTAHDWLHNHKKWMEESFMDLNGDDIATKVATYHKNLIKATKAKGIKTNPGCLAIGQTIKKEVEAFRPHLPLIIALLNPGMRTRHWELLSQKLPFEFKPDEALTLNKVVDDMKMGQYLDVISKVGDSAAKEYQIESALNKMEEAWKGQEFEVNEHKSGTYVIKVRDEALQLLDEHLVTTQAMQFSPYRKPFQERITRWYAKLNTVSEVIEECLAVQRQWLGLQAIFSSPDIQKQLPAEAKRFAAVNKSWRLTMQRVHANPDVLSFCDDPGLLSKLVENNKQLQLVQKRLSDYLDKKRGLFARFYFLSDGELLQILSQTQDPTAVQPHMKKCFENIARLQFERDLTITAMYSSEPAERMPFIKPVDPKRKNVEYWLGDVEQAMKDSVREQLRLAVKNYQQIPRTDWVRSWPGQAVLNGSQIHFTWEVEQALRKGGADGIAKYHQLLVQQIAGLVGLVRGELTDIQRIIMGALIVLDVHARDVVDRLKREGVSDPSDFAWICQLRYYQEEQGLVVEMVKSTFPYSYEYLGNTDRLVITPLTDRCYLTLMTALQLHLGGSPSGPAGTGKTETVKDLAKAVAKKCVVFNCS